MLFCNFSEKKDGVSSIYETKNTIKQFISPWSTDLFNLKYQSLEVVDCGSETQLQVTENLCYL